LSLDKISGYVQLFLKLAATYQEYKFLVTPIGCGYAGYTPLDIAPLFKDAPTNVILPDEFLKVLQQERL
jgi:hypothetical protein